MKIRIKSKTKKGRFIYGDFLKNKNANITVIFLSGFSGSKEFPLFKRASNIFLKNGFNVVRLNFCSDSGDSYKKNNVLKLEEMSFLVYTTELKNIIDIFNKKCSKIALVGHSFGAIISIMFLNKYRKYLKNTELVLWDPSLLPWKKKLLDQEFDHSSGFYHRKGGNELLNKTFYEECATTNIIKIFHSLNKKAYVIAAKNSADKDALRYDFKPMIIKNTNHFFDGEKAQKELFGKTVSFLKNLTW
jgi:predicted alpha/beta-fold hydrolase